MIEFVANESAQHLADQFAIQGSQIQARAVAGAPLGLVTLLRTRRQIVNDEFPFNLESKFTVSCKGVTVQNLLRTPFAVC